MPPNRAKRQQSNTYRWLKLQREWGVVVRVREPHPGDKVRVLLRSGSTTEETVKQVLWHGAGVWLCRIAQQPTTLIDASCLDGDGTDRVVTASEKYPHLTRP